MTRSGLYVQLDVNFPDDDKIEAVGLAGAGLYAQALCLSKRLMSDGRLLRTKLHKLGADDDLIDRCVSVGLFVVRADAPDAVFIAAWMGHNESAADIEERRAKDAARKRLTRANRPPRHAADSERTPSGRADTEEKRREEKRTHTRAEPQPSLAVVPEPASSAAADGAPDGFAEFWTLVRLKADKANAAKAWRKATTGPKRADPDVIRARWAVQLKRWDAEGRPREKHPYAATWLNGRRWEDDDLDPRPVNLGPNEVYDTVNLGPHEVYR